MPTYANEFVGKVIPKAHSPWPHNSHTFSKLLYFLTLGVIWLMCGTTSTNTHTHRTHKFEQITVGAVEPCNNMNVRAFSRAVTGKSHFTFSAKRQTVRREYTQCNVPTILCRQLCNIPQDAAIAGQHYFVDAAKHAVNYARDGFKATYISAQKHSAKLRFQF